MSLFENRVIIVGGVSGIVSETIPFAHVATQSQYIYRLKSCATDTDGIHHHQNGSPRYISRLIVAGSNDFKQQ